MILDTEHRGRIDGLTLEDAFDQLAAARHTEDFWQWPRRRIAEESLRNARRGPSYFNAFVESAVNDILSKRMIKKQQMRWNRWTVQPFLDVRNSVLNKTLCGSFKRLYRDFQTDNKNHAVRLAAR